MRTLERCLSHVDNEAQSCSLSTPRARAGGHRYPKRRGIVNHISCASSLLLLWIKGISFLVDVNHKDQRMDLPRYRAKPVRQTIALMMTAVARALYRSERYELTSVTRGLVIDQDYNGHGSQESQRTYKPGGERWHADQLRSGRAETELVNDGWQEEC